MLLEYIIVGLIVAAAAVLTVRSLSKSAKAESSCCGSDDCAFKRELRDRCEREERNSGNCPC